jgi:pyruvate/2-oxoglutarate/acetoin dehydrogenase E1 component
MAEMTYSEALNLALREEMGRDPAVCGSKITSNSSVSFAGVENLLAQGLGVADDRLWGSHIDQRAGYSE